MPTFYGIEGKVTDYLDIPTIGYVRLKSGDVFVTQHSEDTTPVAIQRGVNVAEDNDINVLLAHVLWRIRYLNQNALQLIQRSASSSNGRGP